MLKPHLARETIIETERTTMRPHTLEDFEDCAGMWAMAEVVRYISGQPSTRNEAWARHLRHIGHWSALGFGYWVVRDKGSNAFLGEVGFADFKRDIVPPLDNFPEIGWVLVPNAHGRGLATETALAAVKWGDQNFLSGKSVCIIAPEHTASINLAERLGYQKMSTVSMSEHLTLVLERIRG